LNKIQYDEKILLDTLEFCHKYIEHNHNIFSCIFIVFYQKYLKIEHCEIFFQYHLHEKHIGRTMLIQYMISMVHDEKLNIKKNLFTKVKNIKELLVICLYNISFINYHNIDILDMIINDENYQDGYYLSYYEDTYLFPNISIVYYFFYILNQSSFNFSKRSIFKNYIISGISNVGTNIDVYPEIFIERFGKYNKMNQNSNFLLNIIIEQIENRKH
jgi:hypothetical protein